MQCSINHWHESAQCGAIPAAPTSAAIAKSFLVPHYRTSVCQTIGSAVSTLSHDASSSLSHCKALLLGVQGQLAPYCGLADPQVMEMCAGLGSSRLHQACQRVLPCQPRCCGVAPLALHPYLLVVSQLGMHKQQCHMHVLAMC